MTEPFKVEDSVGYDAYAYQRAKRLCKRIQYKKDWRLRPLPNGMILISTSVDDVGNPTEKILLNFSVQVSQEVDDDRALYAIWMAILDMEKHEAGEWFKVDRKAIHNEHDLMPKFHRGGGGR